MKILSKLLLLAGFIFLNNANAQKTQAVEIPGTKVLTIHSTIVDQEYKLLINIPRFFDDTTKILPVIYLLDAQWDFPLLNAIYGEQYFDGFLPEAIIVGITWGGENPNPDLLRRRDFTPTEEKLQLPSGGADKFLSFIKNELVPFIDTEFRTKTNDRTLMGSSLGGLFTLYAMLNETSLFNKYVLTSPAISWDSGVIYSNEEKYFNKKHDLPVKLFMAIGEYEDVKDFEKFSTKLSERHYSDFQMKTRVLDGIGHSGTKAEGYTRGLQYAFEKTPLKLSGEILKQYEGTYEINSALKLIVSEADMNLTAEVPGITKLTLSAESESDFYIIGQYLRMYFKKGIDGEVNGVEVEKYAGRQFLKKIE